MSTPNTQPATPTLEHRVSQLEAELAQIKQLLQPSPHPWWQNVFGTFADCPDYDEAMRLGREYRESLRDIPDSNTAESLEKHDRPF
ncbi:MAG: hypothetical protein B0A82_02920 [Alkalinema sp. CACIAM 70d]|nr:MAG: hypothetical protein B0A82_02920 [Alkalinema sp. CACIAM 70d]